MILNVSIYFFLFLSVYSHTKIIWLLLFALLLLFSLTLKLNLTIRGTRCSNLFQGFGKRIDKKGMNQLCLWETSSFLYPILFSYYILYLNGTNISRLKRIPAGKIYNGSSLESNDDVSEGLVNTFCRKQLWLTSSC